MRAASRRPRRAGFTLVELVVVVGIIVILLAIGAAFLPGLQGNQKVQTGVDRLAQWFLIAKNRAKHDGLPTGLRFVIDPNNPTLFSQFVYVQQPDFLFGDPAVGNSCFTPPASPPTNPQTYPNSLTLLFNPPAPNNPDFVGGDPSNPLVQPGDYLELFGGGGLFQVASTGTLPVPGPPAATYTTLTFNPRIIRQPRRVPGEDVLRLPQDIVVDLSPIPNATTVTWSQNIPWRGTVPVGTAQIRNYEIMFSPSGDVIGQAASSGKILLWVRDSTVNPPSQGDSPPMQGNPTLVALQVRGGFLGTYPVLPNTDPNQYPAQFYTTARQGRSGF
jgi:prepilin-type N-terminal cleavage/methylation domain-containing protein